LGNGLLVSVIFTIRYALLHFPIWVAVMIQGILSPVADNSSKLVA
jgi:hypothetical protein